MAGDEGSRSDLEKPAFSLEELSPQAEQTTESAPAARRMYSISSWSMLLTSSARMRTSSLRNHRSSPGPVTLVVLDELQLELVVLDILLLLALLVLLDVAVLLVPVPDRGLRLPPLPPRCRSDQRRLLGQWPVPWLAPCPAP